MVWAGLAGPKGTFRPYQRLELRSGLTYLGAEAIRGFDFGFLIRSIYPQSSSLLLLVLYYLFLLLVRGSRMPVFSPGGGSRMPVF